MNPARRPTIADVAAAAGVSRTTVSHALNDLGRVDPRTRERVRKAAADLNYHPSLRAQRLRRGQSKVIALASSMPVSVAGGPSRLGFFMEVAASAAEHALTQGYALVLVPPLSTGSGLELVDVDGAIVVEPQADDPIIDELRRRGLPYVSLGRQIGEMYETNYVDLQSEKVAELLLRHLEGQGARHLALITGSASRSMYSEAVQVYQRIVEADGRESLVATVPEEDGEAGGYDACAALLQQHPQIDAICATVDTFAVGAMRAIKESGRTIPGDVMVATRYDGIRAQTSRPPLTAVDLGLVDATARAVELLLMRFDGDTVPTAVAAPAIRLVLRESSQRH